MFQMIEHIDNPKKYSESFKILKENGVLVIETPDINSWDYKIFKKNIGLDGMLQDIGIYLKIIFL